MQHEFGEEEEKKSAYKLLVVNPDGRKPVGRSRYWRLDNITVGLREIE
jgi:hypothetical protein